MADVLLEMRGIEKVFPGGVRALDKVNISVRAGEIHALVGENGAGKSTLMNVLSGVYPFGSYGGKILYAGEECRFHNIRESERVGIVIIHQELALIPYLSVMENIFLGNERQQRGIIDWETVYERATELMRRVGLDASPEMPVGKMGVGQQQLVEIAKALAKDVRLLILDEPTAALNDDDSEKLLNLILELRERLGMTAIIISHKLNEVTRIADKITVIRDGRTIETLTKGTDEISEERIIRGMVGRAITDRYPARTAQRIGEVCLEVRDWCVDSPYIAGRRVVDHVNLRLRRGEVVGIAGLMGAGRTEVARALIGADPRTGGVVTVGGKQVDIHSPKDAVRIGIGYLSEDRKRYGLVLQQDVAANTVLPSLKKFSTGGLLQDGRMRKAAGKWVKTLATKTPSVRQQARNLSGGNQQKVVLAKWLERDCDILIFDEPTRGIDVGAKQEIYDLLDELTDQGKSIIMISSEMEEVLRMSDRIAVMCNGRITGFLPNAEATQEKIMELATQFTTTETTSEAN